MSRNLDNTTQNLSPKQIVEELDRFIVGQTPAKKAVALALRNRWRRSMVAMPLREEIVPKNILMIGPTGVGKTEIARRLAKLAKAPFIKVEATKFTEIGYVGRDVESIIRDLVEIALTLLKDHYKQQIRSKCEKAAHEKILDILIGKSTTAETREKFYHELINGKLDNQEIEIQVKENLGNKSNSFDIPTMPGMAMGILNIGEMLNKTLGTSKTKLKKMTIKEALEICIEEENEKLIDEEKIIQKALQLTENEGIVFLDEIDKITSGSVMKGGEVSREGVQRDLLPLIEGTTVSTRYGPVKTDHILFIASGAFHLSKPSDLLPELQGRLPTRVELNALTKEDIIKILTEPENNLIKQYKALLATEEIELEFTDEGIERIAEAVILFNEQVENIGARRLHTIIEKLLEDISFNTNTNNSQKFVIDYAFVEKQLAEFMQNMDLARFIL